MQIGPCKEKIQYNILHNINKYDDTICENIFKGGEERYLIIDNNHSGENVLSHTILYPYSPKCYIFIFLGHDEFVKNWPIFFNNVISDMP